MSTSSDKNGGRAQNEWTRRRETKENGGATPKPRFSEELEYGDSNRVRAIIPNVYAQNPGC